MASRVWLQAEGRSAVAVPNNEEISVKALQAVLGFIPISITLDGYFVDVDEAAACTNGATAVLADLCRVRPTLGTTRNTAIQVTGVHQESGTSRPRAEPSIDRNRERVLSSLRALAARYQEVQLDRYLDGHEELLKLELNDVSPEVPPGLRTDVLFRDVYAGVLGIIRAGQHRGAFIFTGTPGVGKSSVAVVLACELASKRLKFLHRSTDVALGEIWVYMDFSDAGSFEVDYAETGDIEHFPRLKEHLRDPSVLLIWDGQMNRGQYHGERPYVVLSSPNEANFHDFAKEGCQCTTSTPGHCVRSSGHAHCSQA